MENFDRNPTNSTNFYCLAPRAPKSKMYSSQESVESIEFPRSLSLDFSFMVDFNVDNTRKNG